MPLVLAPTIWGSRLEFTLVHRLSCIDSAQAGQMLESIVAALNEFAGNGPTATNLVAEESKSPARRGALISALIRRSAA